MGDAIREAARNALAWEDIDDDEDTKKRIDEGQKSLLARNLKNAQRDLDEAIRELDQIIRDAKFQNVEALVSLAALQMVRGGSTSGAGCEDDLSCAKLNLQRALAIDDGYMPAANQLSVYYMEQAKAKAGAKDGEG